MFDGARVDEHPYYYFIHSAFFVALKKEYSWGKKKLNIPAA
jgi:hypothetical protein